MLTHLRPAIVLLILFTALLGGVYPFAITTASQMAFPNAANGSPLSRNAIVIGSSLIGQQFSSDKYFHSRPSATNMPDPNDATKTIDAPYNGANSSGSNLGPLSKKLLERVAADLAGNPKGVKVPADALTTSASGLDPDITPDNARAQIARVANVRSLDEKQIAALVEQHIEGRLIGFIGEPRINVLALNLALDQLR